MNSTEEAARTTKSVTETFGEVFAGGEMIELIASGSDKDPQLLLWDGKEVKIGLSAEFERREYRAAKIDRSIARGLVLPRGLASYRSTRELLTEICKLTMDFAGLPERLASTVGRFVLDTWIIDVFPVAPVLVVDGPDLERAAQLMSLLHCVCRHGLRIAGLTATGFESLPTGLRFTLLISQSGISEGLERLLGDASSRDHRILHSGTLLDLYGAQAIHAGATFGDEAWSRRSVDVALPWRNVTLPALTQESADRIRVEFQAKLLRYRLENFGKCSTFRFDAGRLSNPVRYLASMLAAVTPEDADLQAEVFDLLHEKEVDARSGNWVDLNTVVIEALLFHCAEAVGAEEESVYVSDIARAAQEILHGRGVDMKVDAGAVGKKLRALGIKPESRDAKGVKLHLTKQLRQDAQRLGREFRIPEHEHQEADQSGTKAAIWDE